LLVESIVTLRYTNVSVVFSLFLRRVNHRHFSVAAQRRHLAAWRHFRVTWPPSSSSAAAKEDAGRDAEHGEDAAGRHERYEQ